HLQKSIITDTIRPSTEAATTTTTPTTTPSSGRRPGKMVIRRLTTTRNRICSWWTMIRTLVRPKRLNADAVPGAAAGRRRPPQ
uniref:Uncharacterized protein n=1 Tax=Romanomermis culicivorax TaxID=13658 RepID=A0A915HQJ2_ROMCU